MAQKVIAARDFELYLTFNAIGTPIKIGTGANFSSVISGQTDDIGAFSTDEPIGTDNGGNTYDISFSIQTAEWITIMDAVRAATAATDHPIVHIRDIVESLTITAVLLWSKVTVALHSIRPPSVSRAGTSPLIRFTRSSAV